MRFEDIVKREFSFLETEYGFELIELCDQFVSYRFTNVFVEIVYDIHNSYELSCMIGRNDNCRGSLGQSFSLGEVVRSKDLTTHNIRSSFQISDKSKLERLIKELADNVRTYAGDLLLGSDDGFDRVANLRRKEIEEYAERNKLDLLRRQAGEAWSNGDFATIVKLFTPEKENLRPSELKKLEYSLKKLANSTKDKG